jgi:hypothetical protein
VRIMQARDILGAVATQYTEKQLDILAQAFVEVWSQIDHRFEPSSQLANTFRIWVAKAVVADAGPNPTDVEKIKQATIERIGFDSPEWKHSMRAASALTHKSSAGKFLTISVTPANDAGAEVAPVIRGP